ncbi:MAG: hypothetical protein ACFFBD_14140 [Candidatus Hodarchaeota archaeon]
MLYYFVYMNGTFVTQVVTTHYEVDDLVWGQIYELTVAAVDVSGNAGFQSRPCVVDTCYGICTKPSAPILFGYPGNYHTCLA